MSNSNYLGKVQNSANQFTNLQSANANLGTVKSGILNAGVVVEDNGGILRRRVVAFGQTGFATVGDGVSATLVAYPGAAATGVALVSLPAGAIITNIYADNNGTTVTNPGDLQIGLGAVNSALTTEVMRVTGANTSINDPRGVYRPLWGSFTGTTGIEGEVPPANVQVPVTGVVNYLNVTHTGSAQTAGDLRVAVDYYLMH